MKNKPLKRSQYIIKLSRDHNASLLFCWKLRQGKRLGVEADRMKPYVAYFATDHMWPHFREEEEILFAEAKHDDLVHRAVDEHVQIRSTVERIAAASGDELEKLLHEIADKVDQHVRFEERVLFPHLEKIIPEPRLKAVSEQLDHEPEKDTWQDSFWLKPKS